MEKDEGCDNPLGIFETTNVRKEIVRPKQKINKESLKYNN